MKKCICGKPTEGSCTYIYDGVEICRDCYYLIRFGIWPD